MVKCQIDNKHKLAWTALIEVTFCCSTWRSPTATAN